MRVKRGGRWRSDHVSGGSLSLPASTHILLASFVRAIIFQAHHFSFGSSPRVPDAIEVATVITVRWADEREWFGGWVREKDWRMAWRGGGLKGWLTDVSAIYVSTMEILSEVCSRNDRRSFTMWLLWDVCNIDIYKAQYMIKLDSRKKA